MLIDKYSTFSWDQAITADAISENVIDVLPVSGAVGAGSTGGPSSNSTVNKGAGQPMYLHILVTTAFVKASGTPTLDVTLESDSAAALNSAAVVHWKTPAAISESTLAAGYWIAKGVPIPPGDYKRYLGLRYTTNSADFNAGAVRAWLSPNRVDERTYESGYTTGIN